MKTKILILILFLPFFIWAQTGYGKAGKERSKWVVTGLLRKGLEDNDDKDKAAQVSLSFPHGKEDYYLINAGLGLNLEKTFGNRKPAQGSHWTGKSSRLEITPSFVFNRNNQIKKEQHNYKAVLGADLFLMKENTINKTHDYLRIYPSLQWMKNRIDSTTNTIGTFYFSWITKRSNGFRMSNYWPVKSTAFQFYLGPVAGLEYQSRSNPKNTALNGNVVRFFYGGDVRLALKNKVNGKPEIGFKRLEWILSYGGRSPLGSSTNPAKKSMFLLKSEFLFYPFDDENISIAYSYNEGQDPIAAIEDQIYWQLVFKIKLDIPFKKK